MDKTRPSGTGELQKAITTWLAIPELISEMPMMGHKKNLDQGKKSQRKIPARICGVPTIRDHIPPQTILYASLQILFVVFGFIKPVTKRITNSCRYSLITKVLKFYYCFIFLLSGTQWFVIPKIIQNIYCVDSQLLMGVIHDTKFETNNKLDRNPQQRCSTLTCTKLATNIIKQAEMGGI